MALRVSTAAIIEKGGDFLMVEEATHPGTFNLPGGGPKSKEQLNHCIVREVEEESGLIVEPVYIVGIYQCPRTAAGNNLTRFVFACTVLGGELTTSKKHPTVGYFSEDDIKGMDKSGNLRNSGVLAAIKDYRKGRGMGLAAVTYLPKEKKK